MIDFNALLADAPLLNSTTLPAPSNAQADPSIDHGGQLVVYIGIALIILGVTATVGFFSRRVEHALITAFALSFCLVAFLVFTR